MRIGHTALNYSLHKIGKHENGICDKCGQQETVEHILLKCVAYERERFQLSQELELMGTDNLSLQVLLNKLKQSKIYEELLM